MKYKIVRLAQFDAHAATIYSVIIDNDNETLFEKFVRINIKQHKEEVMEIFGRIRTMATQTGARENFFIQWEGKPGDGVCALFDEGKNLRLYCIRNGNLIIILGSGAHKPKSIRAYQQSPQLLKEVKLMIKISALLTDKIKEKEIKYSDDGRELLGNLELEDEEI